MHSNVKGVIPTVKQEEIPVLNGNLLNFQALQHVLVPFNSLDPFGDEIEKKKQIKEQKVTEEKGQYFENKERETSIKVSKAKNIQGSDQEYNPTLRQTGKLKKKKYSYEKDDNRNVVPNVVNQIFSFMEKKFKSEKILTKLLQTHREFGSTKQILKKYYLYQKFMKNKRTRHLNQKELKHIFEPMDSICEFFTFEQQIIFIKINIMMVKYFLTSEEHLVQSLSGKRIGREKLETYLSVYRRIKDWLFQEIGKFREKQMFKTTHKIEEV